MLTLCGVYVSEGKALTKDSLEGRYKGYNPGFVFNKKMPIEERKLSSEPNFYTLNLFY